MKRTDGTRLNMHGPMELRALSGYLSHFPFLKRVKHVGALTALLVVLAISVGVWRGGIQYGVDFSGGVATQVRFEHPVSDKAIAEALAPLHLEGLLTQQYGDDDSGVAPALWDARHPGATARGESRRSGTSTRWTTAARPPSTVWKPVQGPRWATICEARRLRQSIMRSC
ncbi:MAG: hypothetical protein V8Q84_06630 [Bilophila sp.]